MLRNNILVFKPHSDSHIRFISRGARKGFALEAGMPPWDLKFGTCSPSNTIILHKSGNT